MNTASDNPGKQASKTGYNRFLLLVAGLGGLLYGVDVGIIAGALPYLEATSGFTPGDLSFIVAAVLLGSAISTMFAGMLADRLGRKPMMAISGFLFVISIPIIALSHGFWPLVSGRLLQGVSGGLIGVVVPLYLAECLSARDRGKGTGIFQWLLTLGIVSAAVIGMIASGKVAEVEKLGDAAKLLAAKDLAWRSIFWVSLPPGILFIIGSFMVAESPRWLFSRGLKDRARTALSRSRTEEQVAVEMDEMEQISVSQSKPGSTHGESLLRRKYLIPFFLACVILACNQATGVNSILGYCVQIMLQGGLSDVQAHRGNLILTVVNFLLTIGGVVLVDRKGRKFLLCLGTGGIIVSLACVGVIFHGVEKLGIDCHEAVQAMVDKDGLSLAYNDDTAGKLLGKSKPAGPTTMFMIYSYGDYSQATAAVRSDDKVAKPLTIQRDGSIPANRVISFFSNPFADLKAAQTAPLKIQKALITPVPDESHGWLLAVCLFLFMGTYAIGPGVCVWLALSELMPTRIRSNGMSIALLLNQVVSTTIAGVFLPMVGKYGYSTMFFFFAGSTVIYFCTAAFFLPETKGKTLEEIEEHFEGGKKAAN